MNKKLIIFGIVTLVIIFAYFQKTFVGYCGEQAMFRTKFGIYFCDQNDEAGGFYCYENVGNFWQSGVMSCILNKKNEKNT